MNTNKMNIVGAVIILVIAAIILIPHYDLTDKVQQQAILKKLQVVFVPAHTNMPPGFVLKVSPDGRYGASYAGPNRGVIGNYCNQGNTRQDAIDRAWGQYKFERKIEEEKKWKEVK